MAVANLASLKANVAKWLERVGDTELETQIPDFILLAEARMNRSLPARSKNTTLTGTIGSRTLTLPTDYAEAKLLQLTTFGDGNDLVAKHSDIIDFRTTNGTPAAWCINDGAIDLDSPCDRAHTFRLRYRTKLALAAVVADDDEGRTNWLLSAHPDIYLWGALTEAAEYLELPTAGKWNARYLGAIEEAGWHETRAESLSALTVPLELVAGRGRFFDITTG